MGAAGGGEEAAAPIPGWTSGEGEGAAQARATILPIMIDTFLVAENTVVSVKSDGAPVDVSAPGSPVFLLTLEIAKIIEQESLDVSIYGSTDGATWGTKPIA